MTKSPHQSSPPKPMVCAGVASLLFAACPFVSFVLSESQQHRPTGGRPVSIGVPPIEFILIIIAFLTIPWIVAGVLMLQRKTSGLWIGQVLTLPTLAVTVPACFGTIIAVIAEHSDDSMLSFSSPFAIGGIFFCLAVWATVYDTRK